MADLTDYEWELAQRYRDDLFDLDLGGGMSAYWRLMKLAKIWHTTFAQGTIALLDGTPSQGVDASFYEAGVRGALDQMTGFFGTLDWTLESMNTITFVIGTHQYVKTVVVGSCMMRDRGVTD